MPMSPQEIAAKWSRNLVNNKATIRAGIEGVTEAPTARAAAAVDKYAAGCQRAVQDGSFVAGCQRVTLQTWKDLTINKGLNNLDAGVRAAEPKVAIYQGKAAPYFKAASEAAKRVQGSGDAAAHEKMQAVWDVMRQLKEARVRG